METPSKTKLQSRSDNSFRTPGTHNIPVPIELAKRAKNRLQGSSHIDPGDPSVKPDLRSYKKSFLVYRYNKYVIIPTDTIAFFYLKYASCVIVCFDTQEYAVNYSLNRVRNILSALQFFRLNRQFLVNFHAIKEVEHYLSRRLLVKLVIPVSEKLLVSREKASSFLRWLGNR